MSGTSELLAAAKEAYEVLHRLSLQPEDSYVRARLRDAIAMGSNTETAARDYMDLNPHATVAKEPSVMDHMDHAEANWPSELFD